MTASSWMLPRITDYWECRANAVLTLAQRLETLDPDDRAPELADISACVTRHLQALPSELVERVAWIMADDLYRGAFSLSYWDDSIGHYLLAAVRPVLHHLSRAGYALQYFAENDFQPTPVGLAGPAEWFGVWFRAAGFSYVSPQETARRRIEADGRRADRWTDILPSYIQEARDASLDALRRCRLTRSHIVYVDADSPPEILDVAFSDAGTPGTILVFRNQSPQTSPRCMVKITPPAP